MRWAPDLGTPFREQLEGVISELLGTYARVEEQLIRAMALEVNRSLKLYGDTQQLALDLAKLRKHAVQAVSALQQLTPGLVEKLINDASSRGMAYALSQLDQVPNFTAVTRDLPNAPAVLAIQADLLSRLSMANLRVLRLADDVYRSVIAETTSTSMLVGLTHRRGEQLAWQKLLSKGVTGFTDKSGRSWNLSSYVEMSTRTASARAYQQQTEATMLANDVKLVSIITGNDGCDKCGQWSGKVLSIQGEAGVPKLPVSALNPITGKQQIVRPVASLEDARAAGWGHPNCRCTTAAYMPGMSIVVDSKLHDPDLEQERNRLRHLERKVRETKRDILTSSDEIERAQHRKKLRKHQAQIRDHIKQTGLMRKSYREQLNLGYRR